MQYFSKITGCSKLVFTVSKELLANKFMPKDMSKSAIGKKKYAIFSNHNGVVRRTLRIQAFGVKCFRKTKCYVTVQWEFYKKL